MKTSLVQICPYCGVAVSDTSDDHIFSKFLGGRRTIVSCVPCNNGFGKSFEGRYSESLLRLKTWLTVIAGLPLKWERDFRWKKAVTCQGILFDFVVKEGKVLIVRAEPEIVYDAQGRPIKVSARNVSEARNISAGLIRKKKIRGAKVSEVENLPVSLEGFEFDMDAGPDLGKLCLKMCCAAATLLPNFARADIGIAVTALQRETDIMIGIAKDARIHEALDSARPLLSYIIYVERARDRTYGIVQFFGALQFYCTLGPGSRKDPCAVLGILDTITGYETFQELGPLNISDVVAEGTGIAFASEWSKKLLDQVSKMGCTGVSDVQLKFKPSFRLNAFASSTTEIWPFGEMPTPQ